jgi:uncharacterized LabA/DUF88 family protein
MGVTESSVKWATYIDGFNFYQAVKDRLPDDQLYLGWCDFAKLSDHIIRGRGELRAIKYFTAFVDEFPKHEREPHRQDVWLRAVKTTRCLSVIEGFFIGERRGTVATRRSEKATDVNIAVTLLLDALTHVYDRAILITGDYDQMPAVAAVANELYKIVDVWIPPGQEAGRWNDFSDHPRVAINRLTVELLRRSRLPDSLSDAQGRIEPPQEWRSSH